MKVLGLLKMFFIFLCWAFLKGLLLVFFFFLIYLFIYFYLFIYLLIYVFICLFVSLFFLIGLLRANPRSFIVVLLCFVG